MNPTPLIPAMSRPSRRLPAIAQSVIAATLLLAATAGCSREAKAARHLSRAQKYLASQQLEKAEIELLNVLRLDTTNSLAIQQLGIIFHDQGRMPRAYATLRRAKELNPQNLDVRLRLGFCEIAVRNFAAARDEALFVLGQQPDHVEAIYLLTDTATKPEEFREVRDRLQGLSVTGGAKAAVTVAMGTLLHRERNFPAAVAAFEQAIGLNPNSDAAYIGLGNTYWAETNLTKAEAAFKKAAELAPLRSARRLRYAEFKIRTGDPETAREAMLAVTREAPDYAPPWIGLADLAYGTKKYEEAIEATKRVLSRDPLSFEALLILGRTYMAQNDAAKAIVAFEQARNLFPRAAQFHHELARAHLLNRDLSKAIAHLNETLRIDPNYEDAVLLLAELNMRSGEINPAITLLTRLAQQQPRIPQTYVLLGLAHRAKGNPLEALKAYDAMAKIAPQDPQPVFLKATVFLQQGKRPEARQLLEQCLTLNPDFLPALEQVVQLDVAAKEFTTALARIQARLEGSPNSSPLHTLLGIVYHEQKDQAKAESALLKAIELDPQYRSPYLILARLYVDNSRQKEALGKLAQLLEKNPKDQAALLQVATIQQTAGDMAAARSAYERLLAINPLSAAILNNLAYINAEYFGELDKSVELASKARDLSPSDPNIADTFGWILHRRGDYSRALTLLQESLSRAPDNPEVFYHLGMTHYMMGDEPQAIYNLQTATQLGKKFPKSPEAQQRLALLRQDPTAVDAKAVTDLEAVLKQRPGDPVALTRLAVYHERHGAPEKARDAYDQILSQNPKHVPAILGLAALFGGPLKDREKAIELAKNARDLVPEDARVGQALGRLAYESGDHKWAVSLLQESARQTPDDPNTLSDFAQALFGNGQIAEAEATAKSALAKQKDFPRAPEARRLLDMISLYQDLAKATAAAARIKALVSSEPTYFPALAVDARIEEAGMDRSAAIAAYEALVQKYPAFTPAQRSLALLLAASGAEPSKAYSALVKARESFPRDHEISRALGMLSFKRNEFSRAAALLNERVASVRSDAEAWLFLGLAQVKANQKPEARNSLQSALQAQPTPEVARQAREALAQLK